MRSMLPARASLVRSTVATSFSTCTRRFSRVPSGKAVWTAPLSHDVGPVRSAWTSWVGNVWRFTTGRKMPLGTRVCRSGA